MPNSLLDLINRELNNFRSEEVFLDYFSETDLCEDGVDVYLTNKEKGVGLVLTKGLVVKSIHFFSESDERKEFIDKLPFNLKFSFAKEDVRGIFGDPKRTGGGHSLFPFGIIPLWDKYYFEQFSLHVQYSTDQMSLTLVTVAAIELEEYFNSSLQ